MKNSSFYFICKLTKSVKVDHQLVNTSLLYTSARFRSFITASMSKSKEKFEESIDEAIRFYTEEFNKMLKEYIKQYRSVFDQKKDSLKERFGVILEFFVVQYVQSFL